VSRTTAERIVSVKSEGSTKGRHRHQKLAQPGQHVVQQLKADEKKVSQAWQRDDEAVRARVERDLGAPYPAPAAQAARARAIAAQIKTMSFTPKQAQVLGDLKSQGVPLVDVWQGSHLLFNDGGKLYDRWAALGATARFSSHYPAVKTQQYEIQIGHSALLFGKDARGNTWCQMEAFAFEGLDPKHVDVENLAGHGVGFVEYKATKENIGPLGRSPHTEHHDPLHFKFQPLK
jgi:hypothetical protein